MRLFKSFRQTSPGGKGKATKEDEDEDEANARSSFLESMLKEEREAAAIKIQANARGKWARKQRRQLQEEKQRLEMKEEDAKNEAESNAATTIQRMWRGHDTRERKRQGTLKPSSSGKKNRRGGKGSKMIRIRSQS